MSLRGILILKWVSFFWDILYMYDYIHDYIGLEYSKMCLYILYYELRLDPLIIDNPGL